jgi:hypothetical protein
MEAVPVVKKKPQKKKVETYLEVILGINNTHPGLSQWPYKFHVYEPKSGVKELLLEGDNQVVSYVSKQALVSVIVSFFNSCGKRKLYLTHREAQEVANMWMSMIEPIQEPKAISFKSADGLTFHRLIFDLPEASFETAPLFEEFLSRCSNNIALCAFIGSLFDPQADRQQYIYLHGQGQNGKGALTFLLRNILGPSCHTDFVPKESRINNFWTYSFLGKRLVIFPECDQPSFPSSAFFKTLTGGDSIRIERKHGDAYSTELMCKFLFLSNEELTISGGMADLRRAIFCHVGPIKGNPDPQYYASLMLEAPRIIRECIDIYNNLCPNHGPIPVEEKAEAQSSIVDEKYISLFDKYFVTSENENDYVSASDVQLVFSSNKIFSTNICGKYLESWKNNMGIKKVRIKDTKRWGYSGMSKKDGVFLGNWTDHDLIDDRSKY